MAETDNPQARQRIDAINKYFAEGHNTELAAEGNLAAAGALQKVGDPRASSLFLGLLADAHTQIEAAEALGDLGDPQAVEPLIALLLGSDRGDVQLAAANALVKLGDLRALRPMLKIAKRNYWPNFRAALNRLCAAATDSLVEALQDADPDVRFTAAEALSELGAGEAARAAIIIHGSENFPVWKAAVEDTVKSGVSVAEPLIQALNSHNNKVRAVAVEILAGVRDARAIPALIQAMGDSDWEFQAVVRSGLMNIGPPAALALIEALGSTDRSIRAGAAETLGRIGDREAVEPLVQALTDPVRRVRLNAAAALGKLADPRVTDALIQTLSDPDRAVRSAAAEALRQIGTPEAVAAARDWDQERRSGNWSETF